MDWMPLRGLHLLLVALVLLGLFVWLLASSVVTSSSTLSICSWIIQEAECSPNYCLVLLAWLLVAVCIDRTSVWMGHSRLVRLAWLCVATSLGSIFIFLASSRSGGIQMAPPWCLQYGGWHYLTFRLVACLWLGSCAVVLLPPLCRLARALLRTCDRIALTVWHHWTAR